MAGIVVAQLSRLGRRWVIWLLTAVLVLLSVLAARHNAGRVMTARADLASAQSARVVQDCIVYGGYRYAPGGCGTPPVPAPPRLRLPGKFCPARGSTARPGAVSVSLTQPVTTHHGGSVMITCTDGKAVARYVLSPHTYTQQAIRPQIDQAVSESRRSLAAVTASLAPPRRVGLALSQLDSLPGLALAVLLGVAATGRDYRRSSWPDRLALARRRPAAVIGKLAALWLVALAWVGLAVITTLVSYAALAGGAHLAVLGAPAGSLLPALGAWVTLGLVATVTATLSSTRTLPG